MICIHTYNKATCTCCRNAAMTENRYFVDSPLLHVDRYCSFNNSRRPSFLRDGASLIFNDNISSFTWDYVRCASNAMRTFDLSRLLMIKLTVRDRRSEAERENDRDSMNNRETMKSIWKMQEGKKKELFVLLGSWNVYTHMLHLAFILAKNEIEVWRSHEIF